MLPVFGKPERSLIIRENKKRTMEAMASTKRIFLLRHGQGYHNSTGRDIPDAMLTDSGITQAKSWSKDIQKFNIELVLVSPLRRTLQTACYAFSASQTKMRPCRHAREMWWNEDVNNFSPLSEVEKLLLALPRGKELLFMDHDGTAAEEKHQVDKDAVTTRTTLLTEALRDHPGQPQGEHESLGRLRDVLKDLEEERVAVVTHWGVINQLARASANNCDLVECEMRVIAGKRVDFKVVKVHPPPGGPETS
ncbi:unnamed protein product [Amoebophrya sp. A25]|nr:unnamed protein product [Amoebophrya sp. A25]|eukprot:GSA25T00026236001.1